MNIMHPTMATAMAPNNTAPAATSLIVPAKG